MGRAKELVSHLLPYSGPDTDHDAILQSHASQLQGLKELWRMGAIRLGIRGCASWWLLRWSIVAYALRCSILDALVGKVLVFGLVNVVVVWHGEVCCVSREAEVIDRFQRES